MTARTDESAPADGMLRRAAFALSLPAFRWWFSSQVFSASGSMTQMVAQSWLILRLGGNALDLGILGVVSWTPTLVAWRLGGRVRGPARPPPPAAVDAEHRDRDVPGPGGAHRGERDADLDGVCLRRGVRDAAHLRYACPAGLRP